MTPQQPKQWEIKSDYKYELEPIVESEYISGKEMLEKAEKLGIISGKEDADYLLEHQDEIPKEWRQYYLIFPKYLQDDDGSGFVAYFRWDGERWVLFFFWLDDIFYGDGRFVRRSESLDTGSIGTSLALEHLGILEDSLKEAVANIKIIRKNLSLQKSDERSEE